MEQEQSNQEPTTAKELTFQELLDTHKEYQAEFDKRVQKAITTAKGNWAKEQDALKVSADNEEIKSLLDKVSSLEQTIKDAEEKKVREAKEKELNNNIEETLKDKTFVNNYTKDAIITAIKQGLTDNPKATIDGLFEELTKDKEGILVNPNKAPEIPETNANVYQDLDKEAFEKMGYKERLALKQDNPELFEQLNTK